MLVGSQMQRGLLSMLLVALSLPSPLHFFSVNSFLRKHLAAFDSRHVCCWLQVSFLPWEKYVVEHNFSFQSVFLCCWLQLQVAYLISCLCGLQITLIVSYVLNISITQFYARIPSEGKINQTYSEVIKREVSIIRTSTRRACAPSLASHYSKAQAAEAANSSSKPLWWRAKEWRSSSNLLKHLQCPVFRG